MTVGETKRTHPIRGLLWGLMLGLGLAIVLVVMTIISLDLLQIIIVTVLGMIIGTVWGLFGPAKQPQRPPPPSELAGPEPTQEASGTEGQTIDETPPWSTEVDGGEPDSVGLD